MLLSYGNGTIKECRTGEAFSKVIHYLFSSVRFIILSAWNYAELVTATEKAMGAILPNVIFSFICFTKII